MSGSRGKQRHEDEHEEHVNHEAWVIPYADVLTLLMALFLVLFALGDPNKEKLEIAAQSFRAELGGGSSPFDLGIGSGGAGPLAEGGASVLDGAGPAPMAADLPPGQEAPPSTVDSDIAPPGVAVVPVLPANSDVDDADDDHLDDVGIPSGGAAGLPPTEVAVEVAGDPLDDVERAVRAHAEGTGLVTSIGFRRESRGLVVSIVTDSVLFDEAQAAIRPAGVEILDVVADALAALPNAVVIEGHTDSRPISTSRYPSNWELSTARATSVLRYLVEWRGMPSDRVAAAGYADTHPIAPGDDPASLALNRRVEIVVLATV